MTLRERIGAPTKSAPSELTPRPTLPWESLQTMRQLDSEPESDSGTDPAAQPPREGYKVVLRDDSGFIFSTRPLAEAYQQRRAARTGREPDITEATITDPKRRFADDLVTGGDDA